MSIEFQLLISQDQFNTEVFPIQNPPPIFKYWWCDSLRVARCELRGKRALEVILV